MTMLIFRCPGKGWLLWKCPFSSRIVMFFAIWDHTDAVSNMWQPSCVLTVWEASPDPCDALTMHTHLVAKPILGHERKKGNRDSAHRQRVTCLSSCVQQRVSTNACCALGRRHTTRRERRCMKLARQTPSNPQHDCQATLLLIQQVLFGSTDGQNMNSSVRLQAMGPTWTRMKLLCVQSQKEHWKCQGA